MKMPLKEKLSKLIIKKIKSIYDYSEGYKSYLDRSKTEREAVKASFNGVTGKMMVFKRVSTSPYEIKVESCDISLIANKEKLFPLEWITEDKNNVSDKALDYILPLIQGEIITPTKNGLPIHLELK